MPGDSSDEVRLIEDALLDEAAKWDRLSKDMAAVQAGLAGLELQTTAFFTNDPMKAQMAMAAYDQVWRLVTTLTGEAAREFNQIGGALRRANDFLQTTDQDSAQDLRGIYGPT
ncbi:hypothetical protein [Actinoplanes derwentensis]|uniref:Excreted virulence factor EspC, type VII ESX diderm n=1 Tax=Actinoplanes derwentensis TaxID=113562 RepID=A0A1H2BCM2_9ACTN|nr:hypothetical protein [Actinoplanes derwentensis]GID88639.1 hypothetical protein Ade03nite_75630 [Actinoplanes derwentensis]SDT56003.1 hypothetical protein SAMN04489716_4515 [Actinoplanes derwentensis]